MRAAGESRSREGKSDTVVRSLERLDDQIDEVTSAMEALTETFDREDDLGSVFQTVCDQVIRVIPGADMASITVVRSGVAETAASTDPRAVAIDAEQYRHGDGPCLRAAATGELVRVDVRKAEELWPEFTASARELEVASYLAAPLQVDEELSGAMNLFGFQEHGFLEVEGKLLDLYTTMVVLALRSARRYLRAKESAEQLRRALSSRAVIEQAKGILMAARGLSPDEAFAALVSRSQHDNIKLHEVAGRFVADAVRRDS
jgi:GAF domain-containing protein